jgi:cytochrome c551/c552
MLKETMKTQWKVVVPALVGALLFLFLASCSQKASQVPAAGASPTAKAGQPSAPVAELTEAEMSAKSPLELAQYIFNHNGCRSCHTLGEQGQFGYTDRGQQIHRQAEGCIDLLTAMNVIAQTPPTQWSAEERAKSGHFREYGCTSCHQITPGKMGLTAMGSRLADLHMSCPQVEHLLNERKGRRPD